MTLPEPTDLYLYVTKHGDLGVAEYRHQVPMFYRPIPVRIDPADLADLRHEVKRFKLVPHAETRFVHVR